MIKNTNLRNYSADAKRTTTISFVTTPSVSRTISVSIVFSVMLISMSVLSSPSSLLSYNKLSYTAFAQMQPPMGKPDLSLGNLTKQGSPYQGSKSAPVTVIDFSDLQCPLCKRFVDNTEQQINSTYIQTGKVALVFKHLPNRGFDSFPAALAAQCTNDQGKFWQYHDILYKNQGPIDSGWASVDNLKKFASQIPGLDMAKFNSCFDNQEHKSFVEKDLQMAQMMLGFSQTPSFIIVNSDGSNPQKLEGAQPFPAFKAVIDKQLGE
ncbi:MAG: DsbA family protein [Candidatus Nitrosocosmicus sp.]